MRKVAAVIATVGEPAAFAHPVTGETMEFATIPNIAADGDTMAALLSGAVREEGLDARKFRRLSEPKADGLMAAITEELEAVGDGDLFVLVLSGHGFSVPLPATGQRDLPGLNYATRELFVARDGYVPAIQLRDVYFGRTPGLTVVEVLDACCSDGVSLLIERDTRPTTVITTHRKQQPTRIRIAAAGDAQQALAVDVDGEFRGALIRALDEAWKTKPATYEKWFCDAADAVASGGVQNPVVRSIGAATRRIRQKPFSLPGYP